jgi:TolB-like protein/tetratricopeptide (TPR) repeat protein
MKRCAVCDRTYADETLNYCLEDGTPLQYEFTEHPTEIMPGSLAPAVARATTEVPANSIAVLPFAHLSSDPDDEYFCDGLAEDLLNALARIEGLKVAARTSAFFFKGKNVPISEIGRVLGVETVLEGSVRKSGDRLRITAQLVNASDGYHIWSERYDREMRDVFDLQDEITGAVVKALKFELLGVVEAPPDKMAALIEDLKHHVRNVQAYQVYLQGRFFLNKFTSADAIRAVKLFEEAIEREPALALAHAGLADAYIMLTEMGPMPPHEAMPKAKESALRAVSLDDTLAEAHSSLGMILQVYEYDFDAAEAEFLRAIELSPNNPIPRQSYAILLTELERHEEAAVHFRKLFEVDPLSVVGNWIYSFCLFLARRYDESLAAAERTLELDPNSGVAYLSLAFSYQMLGEFEKSVEAYARCSEVMGFPENAAFVRSKFEDGWESFLRGMASDERPMTFSFYIVAVFKAALGDIDGAFAELERSLEKRESHIVMVKSDPRFDGLRGDPRFQDLLDRIGF